MALTGPYIAVCGKCNVPMELHPHERCPYDHIPIKHEGRIIGYRLIDKKNKNGRKEKPEKSTA